MKFDFHIHSKYSKDSMLKPETILKVAKKRGLDGVAVTDHNTIKGGLVTKEKNNDNDFTVIVGAEIRTEYGDIVGLFLQEEIVSRNFIDVAKEIKDQGGVVILAHPYRKGIDFPINLINKIDLIEAFNARSNRELNLKAQKLSRNEGKGIVAGSDAHFYFEIGKCKTRISNDVRVALLNGETEIEGMISNYYLVHGLSVLTEKIKKSCILNMF